MLATSDIPSPKPLTRESANHGAPQPDSDRADGLTRSTPGASGQTCSHLPALNPADSELFNLFARAHLDLNALAESSGRTMTDLIAWASAPLIQLWTQVYLEHLARTRIIHYDTFLTKALSALVQSINATDDPIEKRRAATAIIRAWCSSGRLPATPASPSAPREAPHPERSTGVVPDSPPRVPPSATKARLNARPDPGRGADPRSSSTAPGPRPQDRSLQQPFPSDSRGTHALASLLQRESAPAAASRIIAAAGLPGPAP